MNKALSIFNQLRPMTVGFDNIFDHFERLFDNDFTPSTYPFYDIVKSGENKYDVEVALAGFNKNNITCEYADGLLTIKSKEVKAVFEAGQRPVRARVHPECGPHRGGAPGVRNWDAKIINFPQCL